MLCFRYRKLLIPYSEGALDERTRQKVQRHLCVCEACARDLRAVVAVSGAFAEAEGPTVEPAPDLWEKVSAHIAADRPARAPGRVVRITQAASVAAAAVLVAVVGLSVIYPDFRNAAPPAGVGDTAPAQTRHKEPGRKQSPVERVRETPDGGGSRVSGRLAKRPAAEEDTFWTREPASEKPIDVASAPTSEEGRARAFKSPPMASPPAPTMGRPTVSAGTAALGDRTGDSKRYADGTFRSAPAERSRSESDELRLSGAESRRAENKPDAEAGLTAGYWYGAPKGSPSAAPASPLASTHRGSSATAPPNERSATIALDYAPVALVPRGLPARYEEISDGSVVDALNETEGIRAAALFSYP